MPKISVCVPYFNRQAQLDGMFAHYAELYPDLDIEFSVCDDGSPVAAVVPKGVVLTRLQEKNYPLNACVPINRAVKASSGDIIVLTNPEMRHREPCLAIMLNRIRDQMDYVSACCWDADLKIWLAGPKVDYTTNGRFPIPPGAHYHFLAMFTRTLWEKAGGFDEDFRWFAGCDDADWCWRAHKAGANFLTVPCVVEHYQRGRGRGGEPYDWNLRHGTELANEKWPEAWKTTSGS